MADQNKAAIASYPERIYLQGANEHDDGTDPYAVAERGELTWCQDSINKFDIEYVRADLAAPAVPAVDALTRYEPANDGEMLSIAESQEGKHPNEYFLVADVQALLAQPADPEQAIPEGFALVPLRMTREMRRVTDEEGWQWEDLLAAAESITEEQYNEIAAHPADADPEQAKLDSLAQAGLAAALENRASQPKAAPNLLTIADAERKRIAEEYERCIAESRCEVGGHVNRQWAHLEGAVKVVAALRRAIQAAPEATSGQMGGAQVAQPAELTVWYGPMPESNGKSNFTAVLMRKGATMLDGFEDGRTIARSEYPDRVRYEADCVRYLIGELADKPFILDYDSDKHSGYTAPTERAAEGEATERKPLTGAAWREGVLMAMSVLVSVHDQPTMAADVLKELGLIGADCSALDDFDKANLRKIQKSRKSLNLRGLTKQHHGITGGGK